MPATTLDTLTLRDLTVEFDGNVLVDVNEINIEWNPEFQARKPGSSKVMRRVLAWYDAKINMKGFNSTDLSWGDIYPGMRITSLSVKQTTTGAPSVLGNKFFTLFPVSGWAVGPTKTQFKDDPSSWDFEIIPNVDAVTPIS